MGFLRDLLVFWVHYGLVMYINDFPCIINKVSHTILFADDTNILVSSCNLNELNSKLNLEVCCISTWFQNNHLVLKLNKTYCKICLF